MKQIRNKEASTTKQQKENFESALRVGTKVA